MSCYAYELLTPGSPLFWLTYLQDQPFQNLLVLPLILLQVFGLLSSVLEDGLKEFFSCPEDFETRLVEGSGVGAGEEES